MPPQTYYFDERDGARKMAFQAFHYTLPRALLAFLTGPLLLYRLRQYARAGCPDDYPDVTVVHPGGRLRDHLRTSDAPEPSPVDLPELRLWRDLRPWWRNVFYYDERGARIPAHSAYKHESLRELAMLFTFPVWWWRLYGAASAGLPDDYPDITFIRPGTQLYDDVRVETQPQVQPSYGRLRLWKDLGPDWRTKDDQWLAEHPDHKAPPSEDRKTV